MKTKFIEIAKLAPEAAKKVLDQPMFINSETKEIKEMKKKVEYYNSYFFTKFFHHLHGGLKSDKTVTGKSFYIGATILVSSLTQLVSSENEKTQQLGYVGVAVGGTMMLSTLMHACKKCYQGEP